MSDGRRRALFGHRRSGPWRRSRGPLPRLAEARPPPPPRGSPPGRKGRGASPRSSRTVRRSRTASTRRSRTSSTVAMRARVARARGVDQLGQQRAADDDLAPCLALAAVDRPERLEPLDPGLQDGEPFGVVGDLTPAAGCGGGRGRRSCRRHAAPSPARPGGPGGASSLVDPVCALALPSARASHRSRRRCFWASVLGRYFDGRAFRRRLSHRRPPMPENAKFPTSMRVFYQFAAIGSMVVRQEQIEDNGAFTGRLGYAHRPLRSGGARHPQSA